MNEISLQEHQARLKRFNELPDEFLQNLTLGMFQDIFYSYKNTCWKSLTITERNKKMKQLRWDMEWLRGNVWLDSLGEFYPDLDIEKLQKKLVEVGTASLNKIKELEKKESENQLCLIK